MKKGSTGVARKSGGMRPSFGGFDSERMEDQAVASAVSQKALQQQSSNAPAKQSGQAGNQLAQQASQQAPAKPAREVGDFADELIKRPVKDVAVELGKFFDLNALLGINQEADTPEVKAKKKQLHQRYQQLTQAEQKVAQEKYQKELKKKQEEEKQKQLKKQQAEEEKKAEIAPPMGKMDKPGLFITGKSKKSKAQNRLQQQMKTIGTPMGVE